MAKDIISSDFGELSADEEFKTRIGNFESSLNSIKSIIDEILANDIYENLSPDDQVRYDLFLAFTINSLYWFYMRTQGKDPNQTDLKNEIKRVKEYMTKSRKLYERKHVMPRLDKGAAGRFVRSGLWDPNQKTQKEPTAAATVPDAPSATTSTASVTVGAKRKREDSSSGE